MTRENRHDGAYPRTKVPPTRVGIFGIGLFVLGAGVLVAVVSPLPNAILARGGYSWSELSAVEQSSAAADLRSHMIQAFAGLLLVAGATTALRQLDLARQSALAERGAKLVESFTTAVDLLTGEPGARSVAGVYALSRLASLEPGQRPAVKGILTAYVRRARSAECAETAELAVRSLAGMQDPGEAIDLAGAQILRGANLCDLNLSGFRLDRADLRDCDLSRANLTSVTLVDADLSRANLSGADLIGADVKRARLVGTVRDAFTNLPPGTQAI